MIFRLRPFQNLSFFAKSSDLKNAQIAAKSLQFLFIISFIYLKVIKFIYIFRLFSTFESHSRAFGQTTEN